MPDPNVLIIEDSSDDALLMQQELKKAGLEIYAECVETAAAMRQALNSRPWDIIISDYSMPHFNGLEALKIVQELKLDVPLIIVSGTVGEEKAVAVIKAGAADFVLKSRLERLPILVERELRQAESRQKHRQTQMKLIDSQLNFTTFMNNSPILASIKDREGRFLFINQTFDRTFKLDGNQLIGRRVADLWPNYAAEYEKHDRYVLENNKPLEVVAVAPHADGVHQWLVTKFPIPKLEGPSLLGAIAIDITERRRMEEQLQQKQKMEAIGHLAGGIAHDFNNLLTIILGRSELILQRPVGQNYKREVEMIRGTAERAAGLTRQLLQFSRQQVLQPKTININVIIKDISEMLQRLVGEHIEFILTLDPALPSVLADPSQFQQIIMNLVVNARDAMPQGGRLLIETRAVDLDSEYARLHESVRPGRHVVLNVTDTGSGMDEKTRQRLFEPFFTTKNVGKGTGLGLSTVYGIVKQSGGNIWVYSEPGRGSTFKVYLPVCDDAPKTAVSSGTMPALTSGLETVLVVEDESAVRDLVTEILKNAGYQVLSADDGEGALKVALAHSGDIHLLLSDVVMPKLGGIDLAKQLRISRPAIRVIFMSGYSSDATTRDAIAEADSHLDKPFTPAKLLSRVREVFTAG